MKFVEVKPEIKKISFFYLTLFIGISSVLTIFIFPISSILFGKVESANVLVMLLILLLLILIFFFNKILEAYTLCVTLDDKFVEKRIGLIRVKTTKMPIEKIEAYTTQKDIVDILLGLESVQITSSNPSVREDIIIKHVDPNSLSEFITLLDGLIKKSK